jgi:hypothetical protein
MGIVHTAPLTRVRDRRPFRVHNSASTAPMALWPLMLR